MAVEAVMQEEIEVPEGGIAELVMDDQTADEIYGADEDEVPSGGIAQFESVAERMAAMGREGDDMLAHLETGELVIPRRFLEENEEFKSYVMAFFEGQGVDPDRYIAGSDANSLNPETGIAEFFFKKLFKKIKKGVKKVGKAVKKVVKKVVQVAKKVAPVVLPIALGMTPLGPIFGAAAGGGIATLLNGGSVKDALKSALIAGAGGAVTAGIGSVMNNGNFFTGISEAAANPLGRLSQTIEGGFGSFGTAYKPTTVPEAGSETILRSSTSGTTGADGQTITAGATEKLPTTDIVKTAGEMPQGSGKFLDNLQDIYQKGGKGPLEAAKDAFFPSGPSTTEILQAQGVNPLQATSAQLEVAKELAKQAAPGVFAKTLPALAAGTGIMAVTGGFKKPPQEDPGLVEYAEDGTPITGEDKIAEDPGKYLIDELQPGVTLDPNTGNYVVDTTNTGLGAGPYEVASSYALDPSYRPGGPGGPFQRPTSLRDREFFIQPMPAPGVPMPRPGGGFDMIQRAAEGGQVFPRRNGGIMPNEGVPNQDSVRALLMPGEFVMTKDAVKGLGGGNLNQGINNMYSVMRNLESRGRQMA